MLYNAYLNVTKQLAWFQALSVISLLCVAILRAAQCLIPAGNILLTESTLCRETFAGLILTIGVKFSIYLSIDIVKLFISLGF